MVWGWGCWRVAGQALDQLRANTLDRGMITGGVICAQEAQDDTNEPSQNICKAPKAHCIALM